VDLGVDQRAVDDAVAELVADELVVLDQITDGAEELEVCDRENLERLLRMTRAESRPVFTALPVENLPLFLAHHQGLGTHHATIDDLKSALESIFGWPVSADLLETEILPARIEPYLPAWLDTLMTEADLVWFGTGERRLALALDSDRRLLQGPMGTLSRELAAVFPDSPGRYTFDDLLRLSRMDSSRLHDLLWHGAWEGLLSTDTFVPVRHGVATRFKPRSISDRPARPVRRRPRFKRWRSELQLTGAWRLLADNGEPGDALDREEDDRERARILLDRYGVVFRELVEREPPGLGWRELFRSLRMLELAGEVVAGRFFEGVPGLQFVSKAGLRLLQDGLPADRVWWLNAADPASPCGLGPLTAGMDLPRRIPTNHVVFHGSRVVLVSRQRGARLEFRVPPDHPELSQYLDVLRLQLGRSVQPRSAITVEKINGEPAPLSPYRARLEEVCQVIRTPMALKLSRRY
jgi:ATP-dependent Lhr-like helicase